MSRAATIATGISLRYGSPQSVPAGGLKGTPSGQHLEVFLNGDYVGLYLVAETIRIDPGRLDVKTMSADPAVNDVDAAGSWRRTSGSTATPARTRTCGTSPRAG